MEEEIEVTVGEVEVSVEIQDDVLKGDKGDKGDTGEKGERGEPGQNGQDGYTPVKGLDYFTAEEQDELKQEIESDIGQDIQAIENSIQDLNENKADKSEIPDVSVYSLITETGNKIELNINANDFKLTAILKDKNGNIINTSNVIDLPLETMVVNASYDNTTKEIVLTLQSGSTVRFSVADLVSGLVSEATYNAKVEEIETELGEKIEESDLADYVKDTDYATDSKAGVIKTYSSANFMINANGNVYTPARTYAQYQNDGQSSFIGKGTLENVIAGKQLINQTQLEESQTAQDELISELQEEIKELYDAMAKVTGSGTDVTLNNTAKGKMPIEVSGNTEQDGEPTPEEERPVKVVTGDNTIVLENGDKTQEQRRPLSLSSKNKFPTDKIRTDKNWLTVNEDGSVTIRYDSGDNINFTNLFTSNINIPTGNYKLKIFVEGTFIGGNIIVKNIANEVITQSSVTNNNVFTITNNSIGNIEFYIVSAGTNCTIKFMLVEGTETPTAYEEYYNYELCKIGEYKDYIYKDNDKWYVHKMIGKAVLDGSESGWQYDTTYNYIKNSVYDFNGLIPANDSNQLSNYFKVEKTWITFRNTTDLNAFIPISNTGYKFAIRNTNCSSLAEYSTFFANYKPKFYYIVATPTDIEITNTTLINQLEAIYNTAKSYKGTTHIYTEVEEGNVAPILDATAIMDLNSLVQN